MITINEITNYVIDCTDKEFQEIVFSDDINYLRMNLLPYLNSCYKIIVWLKDTVIESVKRGAINKDEAIEIVSDHYILLTKIEDRISFVKEQISELSIRNNKDVVDS